MQNRAIGMIALAALTLFSVSSCAKEDSTAPAAAAKTSSAVTAQQDSHSQEDLSSHTVKSGAGLRFFHRMEQPVRANDNHQVTVVVGHDYPGRNLSLSANADEGLNLAVNRATLPLVNGNNANWTIPFSAAADGVYYINITGIVKLADGRSESRVFSIRVEVGQQKAKPKTARDEVILPAEEKIY